jgi:hypothetical protein
VRAADPSSEAWLQGLIATTAAAAPPRAFDGRPLSSAQEGQVRSSLGQLPLSFEVNRGQADARVDFLARGQGYTLLLNGPEAVLRLAGSPESGNAAVVRLEVVGGNAEAPAAGRDPLPGSVNYFLGNDPSRWLTDVATFGRVEYQGVYAGIDLVYYGTREGELEYDFVVAPGADPSVIALSFSGTSGVGLESNGDLVLEAGGGSLRQHKPVLYQTVGGARREVSGSYVVRDGGQVGFEVGAYDPGLPLVIDPVLSYGSYYGGSGTDQGLGAAVDSSGNIYLTGMTFSPNFPTQGPLQPGLLGTTDAFVVKLNAAGTARLYATYLGGGGTDTGRRIAVDVAGNAYLVGQTNSNNWPLQGAFQSMVGGVQDAVVAKLNPAGSALVFSTYYGGSLSDNGVGIAVDGPNNVYVTGQTSSFNLPTLSPFQPSIGGGGTDGFVAKFRTSGGQLDYATYLGGSGQDGGTGIAVDAAGNAHVTGSTASANFPRVSPLQPDLGGMSDAFVSKLNPAGGALVYSTYVGGTLNDGGLDIALDAQGRAVVTGSTASVNFPTARPIQGTHGDAGSGDGETDAFLSRVAADGSQLDYSTYHGGSSNDVGNAVALNAAGAAYVAGTTFSADFPTVRPVQGSRLGPSDAFLVRANGDGSALIFSTYQGGGSSETGSAVAVDAAGDGFLVGQTFSSDFPTVAPLQPFSGGASDAFLARVVTEPILDYVAVDPTSVPAGGSATGTVHLTSAAPTGGALVTLSSSAPSVASVPASVTVPGGATSATFSVTTSAVGAPTPVTITALYDGVTRTATLTVTPDLGVAGVSLEPTSVTGGTASTGTVTLTGPAPTGGAVVALSSLLPSVAAVPATVTVAAGLSSATFTVTTFPVAASTGVDISATLSGTTRTATLTVLAPTLVSLGLSPTSVLGGTPSTGTVTLSGPAPTGGMIVSLSSSAPSVAAVPASVTVAAGFTSATFSVTTSGVPSATDVVVTASLAGDSRMATLTVTPASLVSVGLSPTTVTGGTPSTGTVTLSGPAPAGGAVVSLGSSAPAVASVPASVTVPAGATTATFPVTTFAVAGSAAATITATYGADSRMATLTVLPAGPVEIIDDTDPVFFSVAGFWHTYSDPSYGGSFRFTDPGAVENGAFWQFTGLAPGAYVVQATWPVYEGSAAAAPYLFWDDTTFVAFATADQRAAPVGPVFGGVAFQTVTTVTVSSGTLWVGVYGASDGWVYADAVRVTPAGAAPAGLFGIGLLLSTPVEKTGREGHQPSHPVSPGGPTRGGSAPPQMTAVESVLAESFGGWGTTATEGPHVAGDGLAAALVSALLDNVLVHERPSDRS